jgi:uncharacterized protein with NRDE domain
VFFEHLDHALRRALRRAFEILDARRPARRVIASLRNVRAVAARSNAVERFGRNPVKHDLNFFSQCPTRTSAPVGCLVNAAHGLAGDYNCSEMCTMVILQRVHPRYPVVVAATRDEYYARPATPPQVLSDDPRVIGGRDETSGGTWLGVTAGGLFVGLTNQRTYRAPDPALRSRGAVVLDALRTGSTAGVRALLEGLDAREHNAFNLLFGDAGELHVGYARGDDPRVAIERVPDGFHVLPNDVLDSREFPKVDRARAIADVHADPADLVAILRDHDMPPLADVSVPDGSALPRELVRQLHAVCIHTPAYGTRSASIVALEPGRVAEYWFTDGPPCTAPLRDVTSLVTSS